jgi:hypothetical protein
MITGRMARTAARRRYNDNVYFESSARLAHGCLARPIIRRESFPALNFSGFINFSQMNLMIRREALSWRLIREAEAYRTPISASARCKRGVEASKV